MDGIELIAEGRFLRLVRRGTWEFVTRKAAHGVVAIVALTDDDRVILVEQHRPPAGGRVIELPAGLVADEDDAETALAAARRELEEETGYVAEAWSRLTCGLSSSGLTDEAVTFFLARGARRTGAGGGVGGESIRVHAVTRDAVGEWLDGQLQQGAQFDLKLLAGLFAAQAALREVHER